MSNLRRPFLRLAILAFALLCIGAQSLIARGFMPLADTDKAGIRTIVICTGMGLKTIAVGADHSPAHSGKTDASCPFAPVIAQDTAPPAPVFTLAVLAYDLLPVRARHTLPRAITAHPYQSQGPPAFSA